MELKLTTRQMIVLSALIGYVIFLFSSSGTEENIPEEIKNDEKINSSESETGDFSDQIPGNVKDLQEKADSESTESETSDKEEKILAEYDHADWKYWIDADGDCQDTRTEVLIAESIEPVTFKTDKKCQVAGGKWICPFTKKEFTDPSRLDVDHLIPLKNAFVSGGHEWSETKKALFANELGYENHLRAVDRSANRSKGARGPEEWLPPNEELHCRYVKDWARVKDLWRLEMTPVEVSAVAKVLDTCP